MEKLTIQVRYQILFYCSLNEKRKNLSKRKIPT